MRSLRRRMIAPAALFALLAVAPAAADAQLLGGLNQAPVAAIDGPAVAALNDQLSYSGAGSYDQNGAITAYKWTVGSGATIIGSSTSPTASIRFDAVGARTVTLTVTDNGLLSGLLLGTSKKSTSITKSVLVGNSAPVFVPSSAGDAPGERDYPNGSIDASGDGPVNAHTGVVRDAEGDPITVTIAVTAYNENNGWDVTHSHDLAHEYGANDPNGGSEPRQVGPLTQVGNASQRSYRVGHTPGIYQRVTTTLTATDSHGASTTATWIDRYL